MVEYERAHGWTPHTIERLMKDRGILEAVNPEMADKRRRAVKRPYYPVEVALVDLIKDIRTKGEAGSVDLAMIASDVERLKIIITDYPLDDVYNADEIGLFLQALSPWTLDFGRQP
ncbi:hypothetical protein BGZ47_004671, partial [Haplosporangium gracile]